ncbi:DUF2142 domain-containing protein [Planosporangium sp. 12N6]|uniref:DUF2142 domain-containing protein n=1 Tax=Planosporangium spinosum TaxID=3402278 RepID=UPI003CF513F8
MTAGSPACWALCFVAFFAMIAAWSLALPVNGTYDEKQHIVRAYAVATGQLTPVGRAPDALGRPTEAYRAPRSLLPVGASVDCTWWEPPKSAGCQRWTDDRTPTLLPTVAARYSPVYYAAVGAPLALRPDRTGILAARLVSALLAASVLAGALWLALRSGRRLLAAAVVLTATPTALDLASAVNPNGLEIAAGILVATACAALLAGRSGAGDGAATAGGGDLDRAAIRLAGAGALVLLTVRQLGPVLLALLVGTFVVLAGRDRIAALLRRRDTRRVVGGVAAAGTAYAMAWPLVAGVAAPMEPYRLTPMTRSEQLTYLVTHRLPFCLKQMVAQFGYGETQVSPVLVVAWYLLLALLVCGALRYAGGRARLAVAGLGVACVGLLVAMDLHYVSRYGWFSQGRYALPAAVGVVLLAVAAGGGEDRLAARGRLTGVVVAVTGVTVPLQGYALAAVMTRYQVGFGAALDPLGGDWRPAVGPVLPLAALLVGGVLLVCLVAARTAGAIREPDGPTAPRVETCTRSW